MRRVISYAAMAVLVLAASAAAQTARWTDPTGAWSLDLQSVGWAYGEGLPQGGPVLIAVPFVAPPEHEVRACLAEEVIEPSAEVQSDVRARGGEIDIVQACAILTRLQIRAPVVTHREVDGVSVADVHALAPNGNPLRASIFYTPAAGGVMRTTISCFRPPDLAPAKAAEIDAVLNSLRIHAGPQ